MKVKELIKKLQEADGENTATIDGIDFSGLSYDDNNDIELYIAGGDKDY